MIWVDFFGQESRITTQKYSDDETGGAGDHWPPYSNRGTQGLIEILGFMVIFDENQGVSDLSKYEFLCPIYVKIIKFLVI